MAKWSKASGQSSGGLWVENRAEIWFFFFQIFKNCSIFQPFLFPCLFVNFCESGVRGLLGSLHWGWFPLWFKQAIIYLVIDLPVENNRAKYRRNMVVMGPCFKCQEIPAFLMISGGLEGSASASHLYLRHAGRAICWWPLTSSSSCRSARCSRQQQLLPLLLLLPASGRGSGPLMQGWAVAAS